jgi:hypothetical protein
MKEEVSTVDKLGVTSGSLGRPGLKPTERKYATVAIATTGSWQALEGNVRSSARLRQARRGEI